MKNLFSLLLAVLLGTSFVQKINAQVIGEDVYKKRTTFERKPSPLPGIRESDVLWSKTLWRIIDLREKVNQQFYYPTREMQGRNNFINSILKGINEKKITAFDASQEDDEFKLPLDSAQIKQQFGASAKKTQRRNLETGAMEDFDLPQEMKTDEIKQLLVKEIWYFDKQTSTLQVRIIGICPIRLYYREEDKNQETILRKKLFWVRYSEIRPVLARCEALNYYNGGRNLSFDDIFISRKFDSYIVKEENIYNNRSIEQYAAGEYAARESERVKNDIFNYEQDLWEY
jgi:gliding motility associated protien GldN